MYKINDTNFKIKCNLCEILITSIEDLKRHLTRKHNNISERERIKLIRNFTEKNQQLEKSKKKHNEELLIEKINNLKNNVIPILQESLISESIINKVIETKKLNKLINFLSNSLTDDIIEKLKIRGVDIIVKKNAQKNKKQKVKIKKEKKYFDKTEKSILPIYTPMGNKR